MSETTDLHRQIQQHDTQLSSLNTRMGHVETKLDGHDTKLDTIITAVTKHDAQPKFGASTITIVKDLGILFGIVCSGILYLAAQSSQKDIALIDDHSKSAEKRIERLESLTLPESWSTRRRAQ